MPQDCSEPKRALKRKNPVEDGNDDDHNNGNIDRLSALPDGVLCHILSFLSTECAASTSILSTRWRNLFISLPDIDLTAFLFPYRGISDNYHDFLHFNLIKFINFGFRVIMLRNGAPIRRFKLFLWPYIESFRLGIDSLISAALSCNLQELEISWTRDRTNGLLPPGIFTCKTLVSLKLRKDTGYGGVLDLVVPDLVSLPNLKVMHLQAKIVDSDSVQRLIKSCPLLEELNICFCSNNEGDGGNDIMLDLSSPSLKKLILNGQGGKYAIIVESKDLDYLEYSVSRKQSITINAPNLKTLIYDSYCVGVNIDNLKSIVKARVTVKCLYEKETNRSLSLRGQHAFELINGLQNVKMLYLYRHSLQALYFSGRPLPAFKYLTTLLLGASHYEDFDHTCLWKMLPSLLTNAPDLEVLIFQEVFKNDFGGVEEFEGILPEVIPMCFIQRLREIEIRVFNWKEYEFKLVEYLLQNGISLKKMAIFGLSNRSKPLSEGWNKILSFKKCSEDCQFVFKDLGWSKC